MPLAVRPQTPETEPDPQQNAALIHPGDLIDVDVVGSLEFDWRGTLTPEGFLAGVDTIEEQVYALCRTEAEVAADLKREFSKFLREPEITVRILDRSNRAAAILQGAVKIPHRFQIKRPVNLNELIVYAGGISDVSGGEISIFRPGNVSCSTPVEAVDDEKFVKTGQTGDARTINIRIVDLIAGSREANPRIYSGDIVTVVEASPVYVIGGVNEPKQISMRSQLTASRAVAIAGGVAKKGIEEQVTIYRRQAGKTRLIQVDLAKVKDGTAEDVPLAALDIVDVAEKGRSPRKFPPVIDGRGLYSRNLASLPTKIID
jgi:protein involved in polysaccharide export with SLBB domain